MGKRTPTPPPAPDPIAVSQAQSQSNIDSAREQQRLNMVNTSGPYGSVQYRADPNAPGGYSQITSLSPQEQQSYDLSKQAENSAYGLANTQIGRVGDALGQTLNTNGLPDLQGGVDRRALQYNFDQGGPLSYGVQGGQLANGFDPGQAVQGSFNTGPGVQYGFDGGPGLQQGFDSAGQVQRGYDTAGQVQRNMGDAGQIASSFGMGGPLQYDFNQGQQVQGQVGGNLDAARYQNMAATYGQAASRLDPMFAQREDQLDTKLANQGFSMNSTGAQNARDQFGRDRNDAYNQAIFSSVGAGENAANSLFQRQLGQGQFANQAAGQQYQQNLGQAAFRNQTAGQDFGQNLNAAQFANQAQSQGFDQGLQRFQAQNAAQQQQFGQNQAAFQDTNAAQQQQYLQNQGLAQFGNQAAGQQFAQNQAQAQFGNTAAGQAYGQNLGAAQFGNTAAAQQYAQNQGLAGFGNDVQQIQYGQGMANAQLNNQAQGQQYQQNMGAAQFGNAAQNQDYQQAYNNAQLSNTARNQGLQERAYLQNQPLNQFNALMSSGQVGMPQGVQYTPSQVANTDVLGAYALNSQAQQANYRAQLQNQQAGMSGLYSLGSAALGAAGAAGGFAPLLAMSDKHLKVDDETVGYDARGRRWASYRYLWDAKDAPKRFGVMAQEIAATDPHAVRLHPSGFLMVDYSALDERPPPAWPGHVGAAPAAEPPQAAAGAAARRAA